MSRQCRFLVVPALFAACGPIACGKLRAASQEPGVEPPPSAMVSGGAGEDAAGVEDSHPQGAELACIDDAGGADAAGVASGEDAGTGAQACPREMTKVKRFCIDRFEASLVSLSPEGVEMVLAHYERPATNVRYEARSTGDVFPQAYISRVEAAAACKNAGKRLCTRSEWMRACQGRQGFLYPYGYRERAGRCNQGKLHLLPLFFGDNARSWKYEENFNSPLLAQEPGYLARTGAYSGCAGEAGIFDLVGNLHEWVSDTVGDDIEDKLAWDQTRRRKQSYEVGNGIFMGGFFSTTTELGAGCKFTTIAHEPRYHDYSTGFRCCRDAPGDGLKK